MTSKDAEAAKGARIGKALVAIFVLVLITGIVNRLISSDDGGGLVGPTPGQARLQPANSTSTVPGAPTSVAPLNEFPSAFVAAPWTSSLPTGVKSATIVTVLDGDTFDLLVDGQTSRYRLYRADTPENFNPLECGGNEATDFTRSAVAQSDTPGKVWIEDVGQLDQYGRTLAYLWFTIDGQPYLLNHILINSGWAENKNYGDPFDPYRTELASAAAYAADSGFGVWGACGAFGIPAGNGGASLAYPDVLPTQPLATDLSSSCHPGYIPCVPNVPYDLDCKDVGFRVEVVGYDEYRLDNDDPDLIGCESWPPKS